MPEERYLRDICFMGLKGVILDEETLELDGEATAKLRGEWTFDLIHTAV